jgi:hypothetical protein
MPELNRPCRFPMGMLACAALLLSSLAGCTQGPPKEAVFPVHGQLLFDKEPATGAVVWLNPVNLLDEKDPKVLAETLRPRGIVQEDGSFEVSTYGTNDGAPPGKYLISIHWTKSTGHGDDGGQSLLPPSYQDPRTAGLPMIEVKREPNMLPPFRLSR